LEFEQDRELIFGVFGGRGRESWAAEKESFFSKNSKRKKSLQEVFQ